MFATAILAIFATVVGASSRAQPEPVLNQKKAHTLLTISKGIAHDLKSPANNGVRVWKLDTQKRNYRAATCGFLLPVFLAAYGRAQALPVPFVRSSSPYDRLPFEWGHQFKAQEQYDNGLPPSPPPMTIACCINGAPDIHNVVTSLWERFAGNLTEEELEKFRGCEDQADILLGRASDAMEKMGSLIGGDKWQSYTLDDIPGVLYFFSGVIDSARALVSIGASANSRLLSPEIYQQTNRTKAA